MTDKIYTVELTEDELELVRRAATNLVALAFEPPGIDITPEEAMALSVKFNQEVN